VLLSEWRIYGGYNSYDSSQEQIAMTASNAVARKRVLSLSDCAVQAKQSSYGQSPTAQISSAAARDTAIALIVDEMRYLQEKEFGALITAIREIAQKQTPIDPHRSRPSSISRPLRPR
jgi:hypothetical protein